MRALRWVGVAAILGVVAWSAVAHPWGWLYGFGVHPYPKDSTPWTYQLWSGFIPALAVLSLIGAVVGLFRHAKCITPRCLRLGHYPDSRGVKWCWKHHPDHGGQKLTMELLHRLHHEQKNQTPTLPRPRM